MSASAAAGSASAAAAPAVEAPLAAQAPPDALVDPTLLTALTEWRDSYLASGSEIPEETRLFLAEPSTLRRYLFARKSVDAARKSILETAAWRKGFIQRPLGCPACTRDPKSHCFLPLGLSTVHRRPILYSTQARAADSSDAQLHHVFHVLEHALAAPGAASSFTWIVSFEGFGFFHALQGRVGISAASLLSAHLPERLGKMLLLNPPGVFDVLLAAIRPFADARTMSKVEVVRCAPGPGPPGPAAGRAGPAPTSCRLAKLLEESHDLPPHAAAFVSAAAAMPGTPGSLPPLPAEARPFQLLPPPHAPPPSAATPAAAATTVAAACK